MVAAGDNPQTAEAQKGLALARAELAIPIIGWLVAGIIASRKAEESKCPTA